MTQHEPEDIDARFDEIMAHWDAEADLSGRRVVQGEGTTSGASHEGRAEPTEPAAPPWSAQDLRSADRWLVYRDGTGLSMGTDHRAWTPPEDPDEDTFVPPEPAPMPSIGRDPGWWAILAGLVGGPLTLVVLVLTGHTSPRLYLWLAGLATVAAFVGLVLRLPRQHDEDDDGARV